MQQYTKYCGGGGGGGGYVHFCTYGFKRRRSQSKISLLSKIDNNNNDVDGDENHFVTDDDDYDVLLAQKEKEVKAYYYSDDPIYILPITTTIFIGIGILYVLYVKSTNPSTGIDIDFYMALDGTLNGGSGGGGGGGNTDDYFESIVALPPLSPAEKIVGALFGPPSSDQY